MTMAKAKSLGLKVFRAETQAKGVTNDSLDLIGRVAARITIGNLTIPQTFHVGREMSYDIILGTNFLGKLGAITYDFKRGRFQVREASLPMGENAIRGDVRLRDEVVLPPRSRAIVIAHVRTSDWGGKECLFEGTIGGVPKEAIIGKCIDQVEPKHFTIRVPIVNTANAYTTIPENAPLGTLEPVEEDMLMTSTGKDAGASHQKRKPPSQLVDLENTDLTAAEKSKLWKVLDDYQDLIGESVSELGRTNVITHVIETEAEVAPIRSKPYHIPVGVRAEVRKQLDELLQRGLIGYGSGAWSSPMVLVRKKDGSYRFCIDYRKLNKVTVQQTMAVTGIDDVKEIMHGKKYFSSLDLCSGYFQVPLHEDSREKSGFSTPFGPMQWNVLPMGLSTSPATFQRLAVAIMCDIIAQGQGVVYLDDWILCSETFSDHLRLIRKLFNRLRHANLRYRLSKSSFCQRQVLYLGHIVSEKGIQVAPHNVEKIRAMDYPKTKKQVRRLLGLFGFYRSYVEGYSRIATPLTALTREDTPFQWTLECQNAVDTLKERITTAPVLIFPNWSEEFILTTDASGTAVAGVLAQRREGKELPIAFYSKSLSKAERKWPATELELYAIYCSVKHFRPYLMNNPFQLYTDSKSCVWIFNKPDLAPRLARWALALQEYTFTCTHKAGAQNVVADALSRATYGAQVNVVYTESAEVPPTPMGETESFMRKAQLADFYMGPIIHYLEHQQFPADATRREQRIIQQRSKEFVIVRGVLYRISEEGRLLMAVPVASRRELLYASHESLMSMHPGVTKTLLKLREYYWFPKMRTTVEAHIRECGSCQTRKNPKIPLRVPLRNQYANEPWEIVSIDFQGPLTESDEGFRHILVLTDFFSKWTEITPTKDQLATTVAQIYVEKIFCRYGASRVLLSDCAKNFLSEVLREVNELLGVTHNRTSPYRPQTNGLVEVTNRTIKTMLSHVVNERHTDWPKYLPFCQLAHNSARHVAINSSPSQLLMGRELRLPHEQLLPLAPTPISAPGKYARDAQERMRVTWDAARRAMKKEGERVARIYDRTARPSEVQIGDAVLYMTPRAHKGLTAKLKHKWTGPYLVKAVTDTNVKLQSFNHPEKDPFVTHLNKVKLFLKPSMRGADVKVYLPAPAGVQEEALASGTETGEEAQSSEEELLSETSDENEAEGANSVEDPRNVTPETLEMQESSSEITVTPKQQLLKQKQADKSDCDRQRRETKYGLRRRPRKRRDADYEYE